MRYDFSHVIERDIDLPLIYLNYAMFLNTMVIAFLAQESLF